MRGQKRPTDTPTQSTMRKAFEAVFRRGTDRTVIDECRRCGTTLESTVGDCPACGCGDIVTYRIE